MVRALFFWLLPMERIYIYIHLSLVSDMLKALLNGSQLNVEKLRGSLNVTGSGHGYWPMSFQGPAVTFHTVECLTYSREKLGGYFSLSLSLSLSGAYVFTCIYIYRSIKFIISYS